MRATGDVSAPADADPPTTRRRRRWPARTVVLGLVLAGVVVTIWPVADTLLNNVRTNAAANATEQETADTAPATLSAELAKARSYNASLGPQAWRDPWTQSGTAGGDRHSYLNELALFSAMGTLTIPKIDVHLPIFHDTTPASLAYGVGHFLGSSLPVGGAGTNAVLAGHSGMSYATLFDRLPELQIGDPFYIRIYGKVLAYKVDRIIKVLPTQLDQIAPVPGKDYVTLVTCVPRLVNTYRLLVRGIRIPYVPPAAGPSPTAAQSATATTATPSATIDTGATDVLTPEWTLTIQHWMIPRLVFSLSALGVLGVLVIGWAVGDRRRRAGHPLQPPHGTDDGAAAPRGP